MFILLYVTFGKFRQAGLVLAIVPLALFGGMLALNVRGMTLNVSSAVGFIAMFGLSIQNGIIMVSQVNGLRRGGMELRKSVIEGARQRFRPILMTSITTILGLFPASLATGIGSDVQRPLATVIVYGLMFSTLISMFLLPAFYYLVENNVLNKKKFLLLFPFLQIRIRIHQIILDVVGDAVLKAVELNVAAKAFQPRHVRLRVILIAALQLGGHVDVVDVRDLVHCGIHRVGEIVPRAGLARTDIQDAVGFGMLQQPEHDVDAVLHIHEIAHLAAVGVLRAVGLEQAERAGFAQLGESLTGQLPNG